MNDSDLSKGYVLKTKLAQKSEREKYERLRDMAIVRFEDTLQSMPSTYFFDEA